MIDMKVSVDNSAIDNMRKELEEMQDSFIFDIADQIFAISQQKVNVDKGTLKKSGNVIKGRGYAYIGYNTPYAETIHDGYTPHDRVVRAHTRINKETGARIMVRSHIRQMNTKTGNPYLDDAIKQVLAKLPPEQRDMIVVTRIEREF